MEGDRIMASVTEKIEKTKCFMCGSSVEASEMGRSGLSQQELNILNNRIKDGSIGHILYLIDGIMQKAESGELGEDIEFKEQLDEIQEGQEETNEQVSTVSKEILDELDERQKANNTKEEEKHKVVHALLEDIYKKLGGPKGIGDAGETITAKELKSICPMDEFSEDQAEKGGTDIVATVDHEGKSCGAIAVSVKYQERWTSTMLTQMRKNMQQEETNFGLLVTKIFPNDALNDKAYDKSGKHGEIIWLVKPEYAAIAYYCLHHAVVAYRKAETTIKEKSEKMQAQEAIVENVREWISGDGFHKTTHKIDDAIQRSKETSEGLEKIKQYVSTKSDALKKKQEDLRQNLGVAEEALDDLKGHLEGDKDDEE